MIPAMGGFLLKKRKEVHQHPFERLASAFRVKRERRPRQLDFPRGKAERRKNLRKGETNT